MKSSKKRSWSVGWRRVSKMLRHIKPTVPTPAKNRLSQLKSFWKNDVFATSRPLCRRKRSEKKERSRKIVVTHEPAMKSGLRDWAPTSEMYAIFCDGSMDG